MQGNIKTSKSFVKQFSHLLQAESRTLDGTIKIRLLQLQKIHPICCVCKAPLVGWVYRWLRQVVWAWVHSRSFFFLCSIVSVGSPYFEALAYLWFCIPLHPPPNTLLAFTSSCGTTQASLMDFVIPFNKNKQTIGEDESAHSITSSEIFPFHFCLLLHYMGINNLNSVSSCFSSPPSYLSFWLRFSFSTLQFCAFPLHHCSL